jgi:hypothetical protein
MKHHFNQLTGSTTSVDAEIVKLDDHFGMTKDEVLNLADDESLGFISGDESWKAVVDNQKKITTNYLSSWEHWKATRADPFVSSLRETT